MERGTIPDCLVGTNLEGGKGICPGREIRVFVQHPASSIQRALALCAGALLTACATPYSEAPTATNFSSSKQLKLQAGSHWNAIAANAAGTLINSLKLGKGCIASQPECDRVYVKQPNEPSAFAQAFRASFITSLVNSGVSVSKSPVGTKEVDFDIQVVRFSPRRPDGTFTSATAIYAGLWGLSGVWEQASPGAAGVLAVGAFDAYRWMTSEFSAGPTPQLEVIVTVSASDAAQYLGRATNVYYVANGDAMLYSPPPAPPALYNIAVTGGQ